MHPLRIKRIHALPAPSDGYRILVDRLWPRGISRESARLDDWLKDAAPSHALRAQFHARPEEWPDFLAAYGAELAEPPGVAAVRHILALLGNGPVTLLFAARDETRNNAEALRLHLENRRGRG